MGSVCSIGSEKAVIDISALSYPVQPTTFICRNAIAKSESQLQNNTKATERNHRSCRTQSKHRETHDDVTTSEYHSRTRFAIQPMHEEQEHESRTPVVKIFQKETDDVAPDVAKSETLMRQVGEELVLSKRSASPGETELILEGDRTKSKVSTTCEEENVDEGCATENIIKTDGSADDPPPPRKCSSTDVNMSSSWTDIEAKYRDVSSKCAKYQDMTRSPEPDLDATSNEVGVEKTICPTQSDQKHIDITDATNMFKNTEVKDKTDLKDNSTAPVESNVTSIARGMMVTAITSACHEMTSDSAVSPEYLEDVTKNYQREVSTTRSSTDQVPLNNEATKSIDLNLHLGDIKEAEIGVKTEIRKDPTGYTNSKILATNDKEPEHVLKVDNDRKQDTDSNSKSAVSSDSPNQSDTSINFSMSKLQKHEETSRHSSASDTIEDSKRSQNPANKNELTNELGKESIDQCKENASKAQKNPSCTESRNIMTGSMGVRQETNQNEQSLIPTDSRERREFSKPLGKRNILDKGDSTMKSRSRTRSKVGAAGIDLQENNSNDSKPMSPKVTNPDKKDASGPSTRLKQASKLKHQSEDQRVTESKTGPAESIGFPLKKTAKNTNLLVSAGKLDKKQVTNAPFSTANRTSNLTPKQVDRCGKRVFKSANEHDEDKRNKRVTIQANMSPLSKSIAFFPLTDTKAIPDKRHSQIKDTKQRDLHPKTTQGGKSVSAAELKLIDHKTSRFSNAAVSAYPNGT